MTQDWWNRIPPAMTAKNATTEVGVVTCKCAIEEMPHLAQKLCLLWEQGEFETWVNQLLMDARDGNRQGLPWQAAEEMLFLMQLRLVKRALIAAEMTGLPLHQIVKEMRAAAEAARLAADRETGPWGAPRPGHHQRAAAQHAAARAKNTSGTPWWQRLFR